MQCWLKLGRIIGRSVQGYVTLYDHDNVADAVSHTLALLLAHVYAYTNAFLHCLLASIYSRKYKYNADDMMGVFAVGGDTATTQQQQAADEQLSRQADQQGSLCTMMLSTCMNGDSTLRAAASATAYATTGLPFFGDLPSRAACKALSGTATACLGRLDMHVCAVLQQPVQTRGLKADRLVLT